MTEKDKELLRKAAGATWEEILHMVDLADSEETKSSLKTMLIREFRRDEESAFRV